MDKEDRYQRKRRRLLLRTGILLSIFIALGYVFYTNFFQVEANNVEVGSQAPNFSLVNMEGERVELADYEGQGVFLNFWATWCPPCEKEMPYMEAQHKLYEDEGVEILAVNIAESELKINRFKERHNLTFPILRDQNRDVLNLYGVGDLPATYLIDDSGEVIHIRIGGMNEDHVIDYMNRIDPAALDE